MLLFMFGMFAPIPVIEATGISIIGIGGVCAQEPPPPCGLDCDEDPPPPPEFYVPGYEGVEWPTGGCGSGLVAAGFGCALCYGTGHAGPHALAGCAACGGGMLGCF